MALSAAYLAGSRRAKKQAQNALSIGEKLRRFWRTLRVIAVVGLVGVPTAFVTEKVTVVKTEWLTARECLATVMNYEGNVLDERGQRMIAEVVLNRVRTLEGSTSFLSKVCRVAYSTHYNKKLKRYMFDFSALEGVSPFESHEKRSGWNDSIRTADAMLWFSIKKRFLPFLRGELGSEYTFYHSGQIKTAPFEQANNIVCDKYYKVNGHIMTFGRPKKMERL